MDKQKCGICGTSFEAGQLVVVIFTIKYLTTDVEPTVVTCGGCASAAVAKYG